MTHRRPSLFTTTALQAIELCDADVPAVQRLFVHNVEYFLAVTGRPPADDEARQELRSAPPNDTPFGRGWSIGLRDGDGEIVAMLSAVSDFLAEGVWLIAQFVVAPTLHGSGISREILDAFELWARDNGGHWIRLAVVVGNTKAERFWRKIGYADVCRRDGVAMGDRVNALRIMVKPLQGGELAQYLALVPRDQPARQPAPQPIHRRGCG